MEFDLPGLDTFVRLADCGCFSEVARTKSISQPAVSSRVAKLESALGLRLFIRHSDGLRLTRDGTVLLDVARNVLKEHERLALRMHRFLRESRGVVKVMVDRSNAGSRLEQLLGAADSLPAKVEVIHPMPHMPWDEALRQQVVDIAVTATFLKSGDQPALQRHDLEKQRGTTIAWNPAYFDFHPGRFSFPEVLRSTILIPGEQLVPGFGAFLERWCLETYGSLPPETRVFEDESQARGACCAGLGVLVFPGDADRRMNLGNTGLGQVKTFDFLLPDAYSYSIFVRAGECNAGILRTGIKISEIYSSMFADCLHG